MRAAISLIAVISAEFSAAMTRGLVAGRFAATRGKTAKA